MATTKLTPDKPEPGRRTDGAVADAETLAVLDKDIDARMRSLLKDHQRMGARPK